MTCFIPRRSIMLGRKWKWNLMWTPIQVCNRRSFWIKDDWFIDNATKLLCHPYFKKQRAPRILHCGWCLLWNWKDKASSGAALSFFKRRWSIRCLAIKMENTGYGRTQTMKKDKNVDAVAASRLYHKCRLRRIKERGKIWSHSPFVSFFRLYETYKVSR